MYLPKPWLLICLIPKLFHSLVTLDILTSSISNCSSSKPSETSTPHHLGKKMLTYHPKERQFLQDRAGCSVLSRGTQETLPFQDPLSWLLSSLVVQMVKNLPAIQETWVGKIPWRRELLPTPVFLEKAMAPHSSTPAWKIPWMEEPGRLQSMGSLRVGYDWATSLWLFTFMHWRRKWQPTPVFLPGESQGQGSLVGCCLWDRTESDTTEMI